MIGNTPRSRALNPMRARQLARRIAAALPLCALLAGAFLISAPTLAGQVQSLDNMNNGNRPRPPRARRTERAAPGTVNAAGNPAPDQSKPPTPMAAAAAKPPASSKLEVLSGKGGAKTISMEFYNLDIDHLLRLLSYAAQVTIVKSDQVSGPITVIAPQPVPLEVAFQILDSVLQVRGYTLVKLPNAVYKVVPIADAIQAGIPIQYGTPTGTLPPGDDIITQLIPLVNLSATTVVTEIQSLLSPNASIIPTATNSLIITDTSANISRARDLIERTEDDLSGGFRVFPLQYYDATEMSDLVTSLVLSRGGVTSAGGAAGASRAGWDRRVAGRVAPQPARGGQRQPPPAVAGASAAGPEFVYPDTRTNSLIVLATPIHQQQIENLVTQLDRRISLRDTYYVYPVQNLVASDLAESIAPLIGAEVTATGGASQSGSTQGRTGTGQTSSRTRSDSRDQPFSRQTTASAGMLRGSSIEPILTASNREDLRSALAAEPTAAEGNVTPAAAAGGDATPPAGPPTPYWGGGMPPPGWGGFYPGDVTAVTGASVAQATIVADDNTNTLLISASPEQIDLVQQVLPQLDVLPPQVHIRAIIAEVDVSRDTSLGFQWQSLARTWGVRNGNTYTGDAGTNFGVTGPTDTSTPVGFFATLTGDEFEAVLNALTTTSRGRVLSAPSIFTSNNRAARISVSQEIPIPTGTFTTTTGSGTISTSIGYEPVGIVLKVTPRITQGDIVQLEVVISADELGNEITVADQTYPTINQREAEASISVLAGNTVVMGGLMREQVIHSSSQVPLLGDLPLIGPLFRQTKAKRAKSELLVFLTPQVVRTPGELATVTGTETRRLPEIPKSLKNAAEGIQPGLPTGETAEPSEPPVEVAPAPETPAVSETPAATPVEPAPEVTPAPVESTAQATPPADASPAPSPPASEGAPASEAAPAE